MGRKKTIAVIGAGASGMTAAVFAAQGQASVTVFEKKDRLGKKLAQTGNGRCNFTNTSQEPVFYNSDNPSFPWKIISRFPLGDVLGFFLNLGIYSKNRKGYMYPAGDQAESVVTVLRLEMIRLGICIMTGCDCTDVRKTGNGFIVRWVSGTEKQEKFFDKVILCCGGKAAPVMGSDGYGYELARRLGHRIIPPVPALTSLVCEGDYFAELAGVRCDGKVSVVEKIKGGGEYTVAFDRGEIQFVKTGISGIPVFQVSRHAAKILAGNGHVDAVIDLMPDFSDELLFNFLKQRAAVRPDKTADVFLIGLFHKKIAGYLIRAAGIPERTPVGTFSDSRFDSLVHAIKYMRTTVKNTGDFTKAQVCAGGVDTEQINPDTMESTIVKGLYFAGELTDVDGICGGYNLHYAWASGYVAGKEAGSCSD